MANITFWRANYIFVQLKTHNMSETTEKQTVHKGDSRCEIEESIDKLHDIQEEIESAREKKRQKKISQSNQEEEQKSFRTGTIVPKTESATQTGEVRNGEICIWVSDNSSGECFSEWITYPKDLDEYNEENQYVRLCSCVGVDYTKPTNLLYEDVPVYIGDGESKIDLPEKATKISKISDGIDRKIKNLKQHKFLNSKSLKIIPTVLLTGPIPYILLTDWPIQIPLSSEDAQAMGYSTSEGFAIFVLCMMIIVLLSILNVHLFSKYTLPTLEEMYDDSVRKINKLADEEYDYIRKD
jgi:hypothetical protein